MTAAEFRNHILEQLGVVGAGEAPTAEDASVTDTVIANCQAELEQLEVALWAADDIPAYAVESFAIYCKPSLTAFGQEYDPMMKELGLRQLRYLTADKRAGVGRATYF